MSDTAREPVPRPWEALARQARALADFADRCATLPPAALAPVDGAPDLLAALDTQALDIRATVADCRVATWQALHDDGMEYAAIGRLWGGKQRSTVGKALNARDRPR